MLMLSVAAVGVIGVARYASRSNRSARQASIKPGTPSTAYQLIQSVERLPLLQQERLIRTYRNDTVRWPVVVEEIVKEHDPPKTWLLLKDPKDASIEIEAYGLKRRDLPLLKQLKRNQKITIIGKISGVEKRVVILENIRIVDS
jgi:hypothetical protein